jgi:hypothetical protein
MKRKPKSMRGLENLGRVRLSKHVYMRDCLYSEIGNLYGIPNIPDHPDVAIKTGKVLAQTLLDPLFETFGPVAIRSAYRAPALNEFGNKNNLNCASNKANHGRHIWDYPDANGCYGATTSIAIPWFADQYDQGRDWRDLAYWIHDHLPYSTLWFFPKLAAFNIEWHERPLRKISSYIAPKGTLVRAGQEPPEPLPERQKRYADFPPYKEPT